jgi:hypothetical protein
LRIVGIVIQGDLSEADFIISQEQRRSFLWFSVARIARFGFSLVLGASPIRGCVCGCHSWVIPLSNRGWMLV